MEVNSKFILMEVDEALMNAIIEILQFVVFALMLWGCIWFLTRKKDKNNGR